MIGESAHLAANKAVRDRMAAQPVDLDDAIALHRDFERAKIGAVERTSTGANGRGGGHIFNLGHGLLADTPVNNVKFMVDYVRLRFTTT